MSLRSRHDAPLASIAKRNPRKGHRYLGTRRHVWCSARYVNRHNDGWANYQEAFSVGLDMVIAD